MRRTLTFFLALFLLGGEIEAQDRNQRDSEPGPVGLLLQQRAELGLTDDQVGRLRAIDHEMDRLNQPLVARLIEIRKQTRELGPRGRLSPEDRKVADGLMAEGRQLLREIDGNNRVAMHEIGDVLTTSQKDQIARYLQQLGESIRERSDGAPGIPGRGH